MTNDPETQLDPEKSPKKNFYTESRQQLVSSQSLNFT